jgi:UDP-glucose 4-epimerase
LINPPLVVGSNGLLGQALVRREPDAFVGRPVPWDRPDEATRVLTSSVRRYAEIVRDQWTVVWAAGAAVVSTDERVAEIELEHFRALVSAVHVHLPAGRGVFFLSSSAGGIYAGSSGAPFDETSEVVPLSAYGRLKLAMEQVAVDVLGEHCHVAIGRFSNLYGPGQNLEKAQGLISKLCLHALTRTALSIYVPLETMRDYLYVDDAAALAASTIEAARRSSPVGTSLRVLASGESATVARLITMVARQHRHRLLISLGVNPSSAFQVRDLRLRSLHGQEQAGAVRTTLNVGVAQVFDHTATLFRAGDFASALPG